MVKNKKWKSFYLIYLVPFVFFFIFLYSGQRKYQITTDYFSIDHAKLTELTIAPDGTIGDYENYRYFELTCDVTNHSREGIFDADLGIMIDIEPDVGSTCKTYHMNGKKERIQDELGSLSCLRETIPPQETVTIRCYVTFDKEETGCTIYYNNKERYAPYHDYTDEIHLEF